MVSRSRLGEMDREIEADSESGNLDFLLREAAEAKKGNRLKDG